jgi:hypothetical protein
VGPAGRRHEVAPGLEARGGLEPLLGASDVGRSLAGAQQPAVDLAGGDDTDHLACGDHGHRLVEQRHSFDHPPGRDVRVAEQGHGIELEVLVAVAPRDLDCRCRELLALGRIGGPRGAIEHVLADIENGDDSDTEGGDVRADYDRRVVEARHCDRSGWSERPSRAGGSRQAPMDGFGDHARAAALDPQPPGAAGHQ